MADGNTFARRLGEIASTIEKNANTAVQKAAFAIEARLVTSTPVDTGRARSNWLASLRYPRTDTVEPTSVADTITRARAVIELRRQHGGAIYLSNNVPYIGSLNAGSSAQAPAAFVEKAVLAGAAVVRGARLLGRLTLDGD